MAIFVLIPGAGGQAAYWDETVAELEERSHRAVAVDIREDDPALGLRDYAAAVEALIAATPPPVVVAQSLGGFTAAMLRTPPARIVLVNAMVPLPGETPGDWWANVGAVGARETADVAAGRPGGFDLETHFLHDIPADVKRRMYDDGMREPSQTPFGQPCEFDAWPDVPIHVLVGADDRFFPPQLQVRVARERLGVEADVVPGGHLLAKSRPAELADRLIAYADDN